MQKLLFIFLILGFYTIAKENPLTNKTVYVVPTIYCDTNEIYAREVFIEVATQLKQVTSLASCEVVEDSAMLEYHLNYHSKPIIPELSEKCSSDYIVVLSFKNRNKIEHREGFVMEIPFFVPDFDQTFLEILMGNRPKKEYKPISITKHREGWKYHYSTTITCTFYESSNGRRVFVASEMHTGLIKSRKDDMGNSDRYAVTYLENITHLAKIIRQQCENWKAWERYLELVNNASLD